MRSASVRNAQCGFQTTTSSHSLPFLCAPATLAQTLFDLKLLSFDAKSKIKVIKEVRTITGLGLKEAKELVEGAPKTVKKDIKKEEAEELAEKIKAVGGECEVE